MSLRNAVPLQFSPYGASDALDSTNLRQGKMQSLSNLIPDPSTKNLWQCRPAARELTTFSTFTTPSFISVLEVFGNFAYGMIASGRFAGHDEPFMYNLLSNTFVTISGVTSANTPTSPPSSGIWTPPSMAPLGGFLLITHPGFNFGGGYAFGVLNIANPSAPTWTAQNTTTNALAALPSWVANFNNRAYFLVNIPAGQPAAYFTDVLALSVTNANQIITFDDNEALTAAAGLGLFSQLGGVVQALMVFKNSANVYQITGDAALSNLARNSLNIATGTLSANSIVNTPIGLAFLAPDGLRVIDFTARMSDPLGVDGEGINTPFIFSVVPSRVQAACNQNVLRVSVQNGNAIGSPNQDWWFDLSRKKWSGPHTFPASMIAAWNNTFVMTPVGVTNSLWQSDVTQSGISTFVENGQQMMFNFVTSMLPDPQTMCFFAMVESTLNMQLVDGQGIVIVQAIDQNGIALGVVNVVPASGATQWGQFVWGQALWSGATAALFPIPLEWLTPIVFRRLQIGASGNCVSGYKIGDLFLRYQKLGYMAVYPASTLTPPSGTFLTDDLGNPLTDDITGAELTAG